MANGAPTVSNGLVISGVTTSTTFSGSGASLTNIPSAQLTGALPSISGANLTNLPASQLTGALPALDGSNLTGLSGVSVANQADNRLITATGTTDALNGEANLTFDGTVLSTDQIRYAAGGNKYHGNPRSVVIGYSGSNYANLGMGWVPTSTNDVYTSANSDYQSRLELYDGLQIYGSGVSVTSGQNVTWKNVADFKPSAIKFYSNGNEKLRLDSSGRLLLGTTSRGQDDADNLTLDGSGEGTGRTGITIRSATNTFGSIFFSDATSGAAQYDGVIAYDHSTQTMRFSTASTQHMFINSNGVVTMPNTPAFRATLSGGPQGINGTVPFDTVDYNVGSNFNNSNHRFTAPVAGRYAFHFYSIYRGNHTNNAFGFYKNGGGFGGDRAHFTRSLGGAWDYIDMSQVLNLAAGDYVTCVTHNAVDLHGGNWAAFSGHLVG